MNRTMTVAQLASYLKGVFDDEELLHDVTLSGEVADISYSDRHTFLVLAENEYSVRCVRFSSRDNIEKGARVALRGSVGYYDKRGSVSFIYTEFFVCGEGEKKAKLAATAERLRLQGLFENRPKLPEYVADVVAVTSPDGAAIRDFIRVVSDKNPFVRIRVCPVKVQGEGAAAGIARAIERLQSVRTDAIVICRGGGSDEDLDCFNDEKLALAVAASRIPIVSAVGHEIDYTLCDHCAGTRAGTPSIAGEIINARASALVEALIDRIFAGYAALGAKFDERKNRLERVCRRAEYAIGSRVADAKHGVELAIRRGGYALERRLDGERRRVKELANRLLSAATRLYERRADKLDKLSATLKALDPHRIIKSGYAAVISDGRAVTSVRSLEAGKIVKLVFSDGTAVAVVQTITDKV